MTTIESVQNPLTSPTPAEIRLPKAPLARVVAQIRFPMIAAISDQSFIAPFQESLRSEYQILAPERVTTIALDAAPATPAPASVIWRLRDLDGHWTVSLASDFVALQTDRYTVRDEFIARLRRVLDVTSAQVKPSLAQRIGIRYIDRVSGVDAKELIALVRSEARGLVGSPVLAGCVHAISDNLFQLEAVSGHLRARWGLLPKNATHDPAAMEPVEHASWFLDVDAYSQERRNFDADTLSATTCVLADRAYTFFRWMVTTEFLRRFGGDV